MLRAFLITALIALPLAARAAPSPTTEADKAARLEKARAAAKALAKEKSYLEAVVAASLAIARGDEKAAYQVYLPLAENGHPDAQYSIGFMTANGKGVEQDLGEAIKWYKKAADQNHETAQLSLGLMYRDGKGIRRDLVRAHMWLSLAAAQGQKEAQKELAETAAMMTGDQIAQSREMMRDWLDQHKEDD